MIYITGDTHGAWRKRLNKDAFPEQSEMTKEDYVIILGDFGIYDNSYDEIAQLDWLNERTFTTLFIAGNHENYDILDSLPIEEWHGGKVNFIRPSVIHLRRGQVYDINGLNFFTFGGAESHDIRDGILEPNDLDFEMKKRELEKKAYPLYRINHINWWEREMPSPDEIEEGIDNLNKHDNKVDYILTHSPYSRILMQWYGGKGMFKCNLLTHFLQCVKETVSYKHWFFGHLHITEVYEGERATCLYREMVRII